MKILLKEIKIRGVRFFFYPRFFTLLKANQTRAVFNFNGTRFILVTMWKFIHALGTPRSLLNSINNLIYDNIGYYIFLFRYVIYLVIFVNMKMYHVIT